MHNELWNREVLCYIYVMLVVMLIDRFVVYYLYFIMLQQHESYTI